MPNGFQPEWRRSRGDAVLDGEAAMERLGWANYKIDVTYEEVWGTEKRHRWFIAREARRANGTAHTEEETCATS